MSQPTSVSTPSCFECRRRKIKCDRSQPCSYCIKVKINCSYPENTASHNTVSNLSDGHILSRINSIERALESLQQGLLRVQQPLQAELSSSWMPDQRDANAFGNLAPGIDSGVIETRQSGSWSSRSNEFRSLFGNPLASSLKSIHPPTELILFLWQRYLESVDSVLKILHPSKVQRQIIGFVRDRDALDPSMHCLIFAIYYAAVITMTAEECEIVFKEGKKGILSRYRTGVESSLSQVKFLDSSNLDVLQAFVIYLICGRRDDQGPDVRRLIGTAIGIAFKMGMHIDAAASNLLPFQVEMRRRLWWQIYILDVRVAEDCGVDPRILESWFTTRPPTNVNDASLEFEMRDAPSNALGRTEMFFSLVRLKISNFARHVVFSDQFCSDNCYPVLSVPEKCKAIDDFREKMESQYLSLCDANIPLDFLTAASSRLILVKLKLIVSKPRVGHNENSLIQVNFRKTCVEILQRARTLRNYEKGKQWLWLFQTYIEWDVLACLFLDLRLAPHGDGLDLAWKAADEIYTYWKTNRDTNLDCRWADIEGLRSEALLTLGMIRNGPKRVESSSSKNTTLDDSEVFAPISPQADDVGLLKRPAENELDHASNQESRRTRRRSDIPELQPELENIDRMWALASSAVAIQAAENQSIHMAQGAETTNTPSSGTGCQWSLAAFEQYFHPTTSWL